MNNTAVFLRQSTIYYNILQYTTLSENRRQYTIKYNCQNCFSGYGKDIAGIAGIDGIVGIDGSVDIFDTVTTAGLIFSVYGCRHHYIFINLQTLVILAAFRYGYY